MLPTAEAISESQREAVNRIRAQWRNGEEPIAPREFADRFEDWDHSLLLSLVYEAYCLQREQGAPVDDGEVISRFPELGESLHRLLSVEAVDAFQDAFRQATAKANKIDVSLETLDVGHAVREAFRGLRAGEHSLKNTTGWELKEVLMSTSVREKATFLWKGRELSFQEVLTEVIDKKEFREQFFDQRKYAGRMGIAAMTREATMNAWKDFWKSLPHSPEDFIQ